ncbi:hypothetical protein Tco_1563376 [Tanacetum coccineum]
MKGLSRWNFAVPQLKVRDAGNQTVTTYKRDESTKKCKKGCYPHSIDSVVVFTLKMDPNYWNKGPRRQHCEICGWKYNSVKVRVRSCTAGAELAGSGGSHFSEDERGITTDDGFRNS